MIVNLLTEEEEKRRKEEEERKRQEEEDRRRREEERRRREEEERERQRREEEERQRKAEEERKRKEEEERRRKEEERRRREEEERERKRQEEEERQRKAEEERKRLEEERANDPRNWPTFMLVFRFTALCAYSKLDPQMATLSSSDSYEVPPERDSVRSGIGCVVRAKPGSCSPQELKEEHLKCLSLEWTEDSAVPEYYMEEVISNLICLQSAVGSMTFSQVRKENLMNSWCYFLK